MALDGDQRLLHDQTLVNGHGPCFTNYKVSKLEVFDRCFIEIIQDQLLVSRLGAAQLFMDSFVAPTQENHIEARLKLRKLTSDLVCHVIPLTAKGNDPGGQLWIQSQSRNLLSRSHWPISIKPGVNDDPTDRVQ